MNLQKRIKKLFCQWSNRRVLREYYLSQSTRPRGARFMHHALVFGIMSVFALGSARSYRGGLINMLLVTILMGAIVFIMNKWELARAESECRSKLSLREYKIRLEQSSQEEVVILLQQKIVDNYPVSNPTINGNSVLEGVYKGCRLAVYFLCSDESGFVETKNIIAILRECRQNSINIVRVFTDGNYSATAFTLAERYGIDLKLNDGGKLRIFLKDSILFPTKEEIDTIIKLEIQKRKKRTWIIRKQMLQRKKTGKYLLYSAILFGVARLKIGAVYWNIFFASLLLGLGGISFVINRRSTEEEGLF